MVQFSPEQITIIFLGFAIMLGSARIFGEYFSRIKQPSIVGEILAGIILGPTILGGFFPELFNYIFPYTGPIAYAYQTIINIGVVLLLMIAGLEIDLNVVIRQGKAALSVSIFGVVIPFALGAGLAYSNPVFWGMQPGADPLIYSLFLGIALSISALPVIAKIMLDLNLFKTDVGLLVMGAAMLNDLIGWVGFAIVLGMLQGATSATSETMQIWGTIGLTLAVFGFSLTIGRWLIHRLIPVIQARFSWPGGVISFTLVLTLLGASLTEFIGIHAVFGAFLAGVIVGDSPHLREKTRTILHQFVTYVFAPLFLVAIGLQTNFIESFNFQLVALILMIAFVGKFVGCMIGARLGSLSVRDSLAVSFAMNARGTMEIILALLALQYGVIQNEVFIALVILAVLSSLVSGPLMNIFITTPNEWKLDELLGNKTDYIAELQATTPKEAIEQLAVPAAAKAGLDVEKVCQAVLRREYLMSTYFGHEVAVPRALFHSLDKPILVAGYSQQGIDFGGPDGENAHLVFLLLTPGKDLTVLGHILNQIEELFKDKEIREAAYTSNSFDIFRALMKTESAPMPATSSTAENGTAS